MDQARMDAAVKHYEAMRRAQKKYYEKKAGPKDERRPRGRPKKTPSPEPVAERGTAAEGGAAGV